MALNDVALTQALAGIVIALLILGVLAYQWIELLVSAGMADDPPPVIVVPIIRGAVIDEDITAPAIVVPVPPTRVLWFASTTDGAGKEIRH